MAEQDMPADWAIERVCELTGRGATPAMVRSTYTHTGNCGDIIAFARYIEAHEEPPVDPLLIEARKMAAEDTLSSGCHIYLHGDYPVYGHEAHTAFLGGKGDRHIAVQGRLRALRRGMELAKEQAK